MLDLSGAVAGLAPEALRLALDGTSEVIGSAVIDENGRVTIEGLNLRTAGVGLALVGNLDTGAGTGKLAFDLVGGDASRFIGLVPTLAWKTLRLHGEADGRLAAPSIVATLTAEDLKTDAYGAGTISVKATGMPNADGSLALGVDGEAEGVSATDPKVAGALGRTARFNLTGVLSPERKISVSAAQVALAALDMDFAGAASADAVKGALKVARVDLAAFAPLAGRPLAGLRRGQYRHRRVARPAGLLRDPPRADARRGDRDRGGGRVPRGRGHYRR